MRFALMLLGACRIDFDARPTDAPVSIPDVATRDAYSDAVLMDRPVAYWRLDDPDEVLRDQLGHHDAIASGGVTAGKLGAVATDRAIAFDGTGKGVTTDGISFAGFRPFTIEVWVNEPDTATYAHFVTSEPRVMGQPQQGYALYQAGAGVAFERIPNPGQYDQTGAVSVANNEWVHLAGVFDGTMIYLYVNGMLRQTAVASEAAQEYTMPIYLGAHVEGANMIGGLDEAAIYDSALPAARILAHYTIAIGGG